MDHEIIGTTLLPFLFFFVVSCGPISSPVADGDADMDADEDPHSDDDASEHLTLEGSACFESPTERLVESKVVIIVDQSELMIQTDPEAHRTIALRDLLGRHQSPPVSFAVVGLGSSPILHAPSAGSFTDNVGELEAAIALLALPQGCDESGRCRDLTAAMAAASALISEDVEGIPPNELALTEYSVVLLLAGPPDPSAERYVHCLDQFGDTVLCDPDTTDCVRDFRAAVCCPIEDARPCVPSDASVPYCCAEDPCPSECAEPIEDFDLALYTQLVHGLSEMVGEAGARGFAMHTGHLVPPANDSEQVATNEKVSTLLEAMAEAGSGLFEAVESGEYPSFISTLPLTHQIEPELKNLLVFNLKASFDSEGRISVDSDADGLTDLTETAQGTDPASTDSDGDGFSDFAELFLGLDPLDDHDSHCTSDEITLDLDLDGIGACEERLLGTHHLSIDTDGDLMPDGLELRMGTNYLGDDNGLDDDGDGIANGDEVRIHTDPQSPDERSEGYEYRIIEQGVVARTSAATPVATSGVSIVETSEESTAGLGWLCYEPAQDGRGGNLCWLDASAREQFSARTTSCNDCIISSEELMVRVTEDGDYALNSPGATGMIEENLWIWVHVTVEELPDRGREEQILINRAQEVCYEFEVSGIRLFETIASSDRPEPGWNTIALYAAFGPEGTTEPGARFEAAFIDARFPTDGEREQTITVFPEEFVRSPTIGGP